MKIFLTNLPSFYKVNLYNELAQKMPILVVFSGIGGDDRNKDFFHGDMKFESVMLKGGILKQIWSLFLILRRYSYNEFIIGGWENIVSLTAPFMSGKNRNACIIESSAYESSGGGYKLWLKKQYMKRICRVYASGISQARLARNLGFIYEIKLTGGCGLLNYVEQPAYEERQEVRNFLYVGRLAEEKNLKLLIRVFNKLQDLNLTIVGFGTQEKELKTLASSSNNVKFVGAVNNKELPAYYRKADVFVLPSSSEPWGLVVEEALNNGCPVIVSDMVGCRESLVSDKIGLVFNHNSEEDLVSAIHKMKDKQFYNNLRKSIAQLNFDVRANKQVNTYICKQ